MDAETERIILTMLKSAIPNEEIYPRIVSHYILYIVATLFKLSYEKLSNGHIGRYLSCSTDLSSCVESGY